MDKEVQDRLIEKCKTIVENEYNLEVPIRMTDIRDSMIKQGIPFNILYKAYHVQEGNYMFHDHSEQLAEVLYKFLAGVKLAYHRNSQQMIEHMEEKINRSCYCVNKETGCIDVFEYNYGVVLFERKTGNAKVPDMKTSPSCFNCRWCNTYTKWCGFSNESIDGRTNACAMWECDPYEKEE